jgi:protein-L-isoaspartate(D-aspartate) O-methyltransferase
MTGAFVRIAVLAACGLLATAPRAADDEARYSRLRAQMVREVERTAERTAMETSRLSLDRRVMQALGTVPRHRFVPPEQVPDAYENTPLPIGFGQTISQPYIVALMTDLLKLQPQHRVLEIGTGSGYQAAILSPLVAEVYSLEIVPMLAAQATHRLEELGYANVTVRTGDGYYGWPGHAPFDAIIVTAAAPSIPPPLVAQLKPGGRMVIPVGPPFLTQTLVVVEKREDGSVRTRHNLPVRFVPLTGAGAK